MRIAFKLWLIIFAMTVRVFAHEELTHQKISDQAVEYLRSIDPSRFDISGIPFDQIKVALRIGAVGEDDDQPQGGNGLGRYFFHFFSPLNRNLPLAAPFIPIPGSLSLTATCNSIQWAFLIAGTCTAQVIPPLGVHSRSIVGTNEHTWNTALNAFESTDNYGAPTFAGWQHLGYVVHLLEDLTSPAHTRNDPHPCVGTHFKEILIVGEDFEGGRC
jgi:hypothetical protein